MVKDKNYIPEKGDVVWLSFSPTKGHEQKGRRPGLILSSKRFNQTNMAFIVPITSATRSYETQISLQTNNITGTILCDHIRSMDWTTRDIVYIDSVSTDILSKVQDIIISLILS